MDLEFLIENLIVLGKTVVALRDGRSVEHFFVFRRFRGLPLLEMNAIALYECNPSTFITEGHLKLFSS